MEPIVSFSGLSSGIQWRDMIDQIIAVDARPANQFRTRISLAEKRTQAWTDFRSRVQALADAAAALSAGGKLNARKAIVTGTASGSPSSLSVSASESAMAASYAVRVNRLAAQEKLGGGSFSSRTAALNLSGEFIINGRSIAVQATDSLEMVARRINDTNTGVSGSGVNAAVLPTASGGFRLVVTSSRAGAAGIDLRDGIGAVLHQLGLLDSSTSNKHQTSNGVRSDTFMDSVTSVATLLGLASPPASTTFNVGGHAVNIDLAGQSLEDIRDAINTAATGTNITAAVVSESVNGRNVHRLQISNTTNITQSSDSARSVAELLGLVEAGRGSVAAQIQTATALTDGDAGTAITGASLWQDVWLRGATASAGVTDGDRLTIAGQHDGVTFSFDYSIVGANSIDDLLTQINGSAGFNGRATASVSADGRIVVTDNTAGERRLSLSIAAHNDGGGALDFGNTETITSGRTTVIQAGSDAEFEIDGTVISRDSNTVTDVIEGVTLNLSATSASAVTVQVSRDTDASVAAVNAFVDAYNALEEFVDRQLTPPAEGGQSAPLYGNASLRVFRANLRSSMESAISSSVAGAYTRLATIGIEVDQTGTYTRRTDALRAALQADPEAVVRLLTAYGGTTAASLAFNGAGSLTQSGDYAVSITQSAAKAAISGAGFSGTYSDDGIPDRIIVRDLGTNREYGIELAANATLESIVASLNAEFGSARKHTVAAANALYSAATGTPVTEATTWASVHDADGQPVNVAANDTITISGTRPDGSAFSVDHVIVNPATATIGELRAAIQAAAGSDVDVSLVDGVLTATDKSAGTSLFALALTPQNNGGGTVDFGGFTTTTQGRPQAGVTASVDAGQLRLEHGDFGLAAGFEISFVAGGTDNTAQLGIAAGTYRGADVQGTIGGMTATGTGAQLVGGDDTAVAGLIVTYTGGTGDAGRVTFSRGIASIVENATKVMLGSGNGSIELLTTSLEDNITQYNDRIETIEARLERRRESLIRRFTAMEQAMAKAQNQSAWLSAQFAQRNGSKS